jgi:hypothetical protein
VKASQALIGVVLVILTSCKPQEPDAPRASSPKVAAASAEEALTEAFISAVNTDDKLKLQALLHSQCRAHITAENQGFFDVAFDRDLALAVPAEYEWGFVRVPEGPLLFANAFTFPVRPTHQLQITFGDDPEKPERITHYVARDGERWALVIPYPTDETLAKMREAGRIPKAPSTATDADD